MSVAPAGNYEAVRALCEGCPVRQECLETALTDESLVGLRGGTTDAERREIRRGAVGHNATVPVILIADAD